MQALEAHNQKPVQTMVRVRVSTREKIDAICAEKHWTMAEAFEQAAEALLAREGMSIPVNEPAPSVGAAQSAPSDG